MIAFFYELTQGGHSLSSNVGESRRTKKISYLNLKGNQPNTANIELKFWKILREL